MNNKEINSVVENIPEALSIYINQIVYSLKRKGLDIITLSLGEAYFDIPQFSFDEIDFVKGYHYSDSHGLPELRKKILDYYNKFYKAKIPSIDNILISCGSKVILFLVMLLVLQKKDEVLIHEPAWLSYQEQAKIAGGNPIFIPYNCKVEDFKNYFTTNAKLLILNNPNNPAGFIYKKEELITLYEECHKRNIFILIDESYSDFIGNDDVFYSLSNIVTDLKGIFIVNSLSKNMGMSGWRIGYLIAEKELVLQILKLNQHIITCAPTILQMYLARYFDDIINITLPQAKEVVNKRKRMTNYLDSIGLDYLKGNSTFYIFINVSNLNARTLDFCLYLLFKYGIATVPGGAYGKSTEKFIRVGIGAESEERLKKAFDIIKLVYFEQLINSDYVREQIKNNDFYEFKESI